MVTRRKTPKPTDAELAILQVLWRLGPSTVREVHTGLAHHKPVGYTTVLKLLQIMTGKGLTERDETQRAHVYIARVNEAGTQRNLMADLLDKAFRGSSSRLVMQALASRPASKEELDAIRRLLDEMEGDDQ
jgi:predicted transcriptional regulator